MSGATRDQQAGRPWVEQLEQRVLLSGQAAALPQQVVDADLGGSAAVTRSADGVVDVYALIVSGTGSSSLDPMVEFYEILTADHGADPDKITYLVVSETIPAGHEEIIDGIATTENFLSALGDLGGRVDLDDQLIVNLECHGRGYLGDVPEKSYNASYHGYCDVPPVLNHTDGADQFDLLESEYELSVFCGYGGRGPGEQPFWDFHRGLGQWLTDWYWNCATLKRWMHLSHYENVYVEGVGDLSDSDEDIDKFIDYALGDLNRDGRIDPDAGEVADFDGDGIPPYDRYTDVFDEDDWGPIDEFEDDYRRTHSPLIGIPYRVFDDGLDDRIDIDVYPSDSGPLEVDGTDLDNNGCIDGIDLNDDGDMTDWVALNETVCLWRGELTDDEVAGAFNPIQCGAKVFITNTCHGGGFIDDLSGPNTVLIAGGPELSVASAGFMPRLLNEALSDRLDEADVDGNGRVSMMEAFNHASLHPHMGCSSGMDLFHYDDNGDRTPHEDPLPAGGDGAFGATVFLPEKAPPTVTSLVVSSTSWSPGFLDHLMVEGLGSGGYAVPVGAAAQLDPLPWVNIDKVEITFSEEMDVSATDITVRGVAVPLYVADAFAYDGELHQVTLTFAAPLEADRLLIEVADGASSAEGTALDGEWSDGLSEYPSGDGVAGGDFRFTINVLPGDVDGTGETRSSDVIKLRRKTNTQMGDPGYSIFHDVDGDGQIRSSDVIKARRRTNTELPPEPPPLPPSAADLLRACGVLAEADADPAEGPVPLRETAPAPGSSDAHARILWVRPEPAVAMASRRQSAPGDVRSPRRLGEQRHRAGRHGQSGPAAPTGLATNLAADALWLAGIIPAAI